jgi:hypothetical protein
MEVLIFLVGACSLDIGIAVLPANIHTADEYNRFWATHECLETRDPMDLMLKIFPEMLPQMHIHPSSFLNVLSFISYSELGPLQNIGTGKSARLCFPYRLMMHFPQIEYPH